MFGNTYYASEKDRLRLGTQVIADYTKSQPEDAAEITKAARRQYYMRTFPILSTVYLSKQLDSEKFLDLFRSVILTPRDAIQFIDLCRSGVVRKGLGRKLKTAINDKLAYWLRAKGEFYATKYKNQLATISKLTHPKSESPILDYIFDKEIDLEAYPMIRALEYIKTEKPSEDSIVTLINRHRLDWNTLKGAFKPTPAIWEAFMKNMSAIALIKNIASSERHLKGMDDVLNFLRKNLTIETLQRGRVLPVRIMQAMNAVQNQDVKRFLAMMTNDYARKYDMSNLGYVAICPDVSGSMRSQGSGTGNFTCAQMAGMFAGVLSRACPKSAMIPWDTNVYQSQFDINSNTWRDVEYMYNYCSRSGGGGTAMYLPVQWLTQRRIKVDTLILLTDNEEWVRHKWIDFWVPYLQNINRDAKCVLIRADSYISHQPYPPEVAMKAHIFQMFGYSDQVFKLLTMI